VVIVYQDDLPNDSTSAVIDILEALPQVKVVGLSVHNNHLHVYKAMHSVANKFEDFVEAVVI